MAAVARRPPAVLYPLRRNSVLGVSLVALLLVGAAGLLGWALQGAAATESSHPPGWAALALWVLAASSALHFWRHQRAGALRWDGQSWVIELERPGFSSLSLSSSPQVLLDLQSHLWVHARVADGGSVWLWLDQSSQPERWWDLRRAVYSRARPGVDNADETAPASASRHGRES